MHIFIVVILLVFGIFFTISSIKSLLKKNDDANNESDHKPFSKRNAHIYSKYVLNTKGFILGIGFIVIALYLIFS
jgi:hypothetical protein